MDTCGLKEGQKVFCVDGSWPAQPRVSTRIIRGFRERLGHNGEKHTMVLLWGGSMHIKDVFATAEGAERRTEEYKEIWQKTVRA